MVSKTTATEALEGLRPADREIVEAFRDRVREMLGPRLRDLRIFGSKVRGDDHEESDIDILVLVDQLDPETDRRLTELASEVRIAGSGSYLMAIVFDFDRYHAPKSRATGFYESMRTESVRL